jgi:LemA protein
MKKGIVILLVILGIAALLVMWGVGAYNGLVSAQEGVESAWADVENQYQRRADLVPNLVATVKGYATHEQETLEQVVKARARATQVTNYIDPTHITPEQLAEYQAAQGQLSQALGRLIAISENYPNLKANENFRDLQAQLEGTENRITVARQNFNDAARKYNTSIRRFPTNLIANYFDFEKKPYFEADEGTKAAPKVEF